VDIGAIHMSLDTITQQNQIVVLANDISCISFPC